MTSRIILIIIVISMMLVSIPARSEKKAEEAKEDDLEATIAHLLEFVRTSDVFFIRNGKEHSPEKAAEHIEKKYNHYKKKIKTPEDFIERSATKSMMSGKLYQIRLKDGTVIDTKDWLAAELARYRTAEAETPADTTGKGNGCEPDSL